jgi:hypothetical protein
MSNICTFSSFGRNISSRVNCSDSEIRIAPRARYTVSILDPPLDRNAAGSAFLKIARAIRGSSTWRRFRWQSAHQSARKLRVKSAAITRVANERERAGALSTLISRHAMTNDRILMVTRETLPDPPFNGYLNSIRTVVRHHRKPLFLMQTTN